MTDVDIPHTPSPSNSDSPTTGKPSINIADILPPAPKGPPPGRGPPPPAIDTIPEEEEHDLMNNKNKDDNSNIIVRSESYTVLNSQMSNKPEIQSIDEHTEPFNGKDQSG